MNGDNSFNQYQTNSLVNIEEHRGTETTHPLYFSSSNVVCVPSLKQAYNLEPLIGAQYSSSSSSCSYHHQYVSLEEEKRSFEVPINMRATTSRGTKRGRSSWETQEDHIMSERKRRQEMAERFVALSAIIPGLKKVSASSSSSPNYICFSSPTISHEEKRLN